MYYKASNTFGVYKSWGYGYPKLRRQLFQFRSSKLSRKKLEVIAERVLVKLRKGLDIAVAKTWALEQVAANERK